jgi:hypothetical protein
MQLRLAPLNERRFSYVGSRQPRLAQAIFFGKDAVLEQSIALT